MIDLSARVDTILDKWIDELKDTTSRSHWRQYDGYARNWIKPQIGGMKISRITEQHLQDVITLAFKGGLSHKTLCNVRACLGGFFKYCRKGSLTALRPENLTIPKGAKKSDKTILQPSDIRALFSSDITTWKGKPTPDWFIHAYRFAVTTGLRPGELIGLEWKNVNSGKVFIVGSINNDGQHTHGKNDNARRTFALSKIAEKELEQQRAMLKKALCVPPPRW